MDAVQDVTPFLVMGTPNPVPGLDGSSPSCHCGLTGGDGFPLGRPF